MKKFLIIDDHVVVRSGIKLLLSDFYAEARIDEAENENNALECINETAYDLVLLDVQLPGGDALGFMDHVKRKFPGLKVLVFTMSPENVYAKRFLQAGARGFLNKDAPLQELKNAVGRILQNGKYMSSAVAEAMAKPLGKPIDDNLFNTLTSREFEIANLLLNGHTVSKIASLLSLQVSTVGTHKSKIFEKLKIKNLLELKDIAMLYRF